MAESRVWDLVNCRPRCHSAGGVRPGRPPRPRGTWTCLCGAAAPRSSAILRSDLAPVSRKPTQARPRSQALPAPTCSRRSQHAQQAPSFCHPQELPGNSEMPSAQRRPAEACSSDTAFNDPERALDHLRFEAFRQNRSSTAIQYSAIAALHFCSGCPSELCSSVRPWLLTHKLPRSQVGLRDANILLPSTESCAHTHTQTHRNCCVEAAPGKPSQVAPGNVVLRH